MMNDEAKAYLAGSLGNQFAAIFAKQNDLDRQFGYIERDRMRRMFIVAGDINWPVHPSQPANSLEINSHQFIAANYADRIISEAVEFKQVLPGHKLWKANPNPPDIAAAHKEIADMLHFIVKLASFCGLDSRALYELYFAKADENQGRINRGE